MSDRNIESSLKSLLAERDAVAARLEGVEDAIATLKRLSTMKIKSVAAKGKGKRSDGKTAPMWTEASREAARLRMKKYWAKQRKTKGAKKAAPKKKAVTPPEAAPSQTAESEPAQSQLS